MRRFPFSTLLIFVVSVLTLLSLPATAQVTLSALGTASTQSFDTLPASLSATWTNNSTIPGWYHARTGTGTTIVANDGTSNAGNLYSYGTGTTTDRALGSVGSGTPGSFFWGVRLLNSTGSTISSLDVSYTGEQWRNSAAAAQTIAFSYLVGSPTVTGSLAEFQSAGVAITSLDFTSPVTGGVAGALNGNLAANRTTKTFSITGLSIPNGTEVMLRWSDPDHVGSDHGLSIDDFSVTPQGGAPGLNLSITDVTQLEGNAGTSLFSFVVSLSMPAPAGGVTFDIGTQDNTATVANSDYVARSLVGQTIPQGSTVYNFDVTVNGDLTVEPTETFFVNLTNVTGTGVVVTKSQGIGTITNDDFVIVPINQIQGSGTTSPLVATSVTTRGIVTALKSNGFFLQTPDASIDVDPNTSEGIFVFTSSAPPASAAIGNDLTLTATVTEFVPAQDTLSPPVTELTGPSGYFVNSSGNPLPAPIVITSAMTLVNNISNLEFLEGMRVSIPSLTTVSPTQGTVNEPNATSTSNGTFYAVVTGVARPFREPGIQVPDPLPAGAPATVPRFDTNPERLRVNSIGQVGSLALELTSGATVTGVVGVLDYGFRTYTVLPDPSVPPSVSGNMSAAPVTLPTNMEFTIASANLERFFDTVDDPAVSDVVLTPTAFANRLNKASLGIRNFLRTPDIIGVEEMENLTTLQSLANKINSDAVAALQPNPNYQAFLVEGNDIGGIDVGFLVKTSRVNVVDVTQFGLTATYINPNTGLPETLNDRPPLVLRAIVTHPNLSTFPVTVIVNHLRSLSGIGDPTPSGSGTAGDRVRAKRRAQAEFLANLIQSRQTANPTERIVSVGDYNAFELNDGYVDSMGTIIGTPAPAANVVLASSDLVNPDLTNLDFTAPLSQQYSYTFGGNAQTIDHILVNSAMVSATSTARVEHSRLNADFPESLRANPNSAERISDHDWALAYFQVAAFPVELTSFSAE